MGTILDSLVGPVLSKRPHKAEAGGSESEMKEAVLWAVTMEEGAMSQGCGISRRWKSQEISERGQSEKPILYDSNSDLEKGKTMEAIKKMNWEND